MVSTKFFLIATQYFTSMAIAHCGNTIACTAAADCTSSTQKCMDIDGTNKACVEICNTDADCGDTAGSCAPTKTDDVGCNGGFNVCSIGVQQCLINADCSGIDPALPICNLYALICEADTTTSTTTTITTTTKNQATGGSNDCASLVAYCTNSLYFSLMKKKCSKTCGYCTTSSGSSGSSGSGSTSIGCADQVTSGSNSCDSMASYCTDTIYKYLMKEKCPKTCGYRTTSSSGSTSSTTRTDALSDCFSKSNLCTNTTYKDLMKQKCPKTCGYCTSSSSSSLSSSSGSTSTSTCKDAPYYCSSKSYLCTNTIYKDLMKTNCPSTCGYC
uniref:ShKT domain-containing protein n=1 Tax=Strongyloides papillosus TaxID=174720 RepID=A0A0N5C2T2_STREA